MISIRQTILVGTIFAVATALGVPAAAQEVENRVVLRVNNRIMTLVDYQLRRNDRLRALAAADISPDQRETYLEGLGETIMGDMVEEMLLLSRADQLGITAPRSAVEQEMNAARERAGVTTDADFDLALARAGMTRDDLQQQIENNVVIQQVIGREILGQIEITEEDLRRYYFEHAEEFSRPEQRRVREVVLAEDAGSPQELRQGAERIRSAIAGGTDPQEAVAAEPLAGGWVDVGLVARDDLAADLADVAWSLEEGQLSAPIEARGGLHVLQVTEIVPAQMVEFDSVRGQVGQTLQQQRFSDSYRDYMEDLRRDSYVQLNELPEDARDFDLEASAERMTLTDLAAGEFVADPGEPAEEAEAVAGSGDGDTAGDEPADTDAAPDEAGDEAPEGVPQDPD